MANQPGETGSSLLSGTSEDRPAMAAALMVGALFLLGLQDAFVKLTSGEVSLWQFQFFRATFNLVMLLAMSRLLWGSMRPRPKRAWAVALRSCFLVGAMTCFFGGIPFLSLAEIAAGLYAFPLFVAILSSLLLGEKVGPIRVAAIVAGFSGTLLLLKPGSDAFSPVALMPIGAALCYASTILTTRKLCREESPVTLALGVAIAFMTVSLLAGTTFSIIDTGGLAHAWPYLFTGWNAMDLWVFGVIALCSILNITSNISLAKSYQSAEASWLAPFDYSYLIFATFWGFVFSNHIPDGLSFVGMALIAGAGSFVAWQERRMTRYRRANFNRLLR